MHPVRVLRHILAGSDVLLAGHLPARLDDRAHAGADESEYDWVGDDGHLLSEVRIPPRADGYDYRGGACMAMSACEERANRACEHRGYGLATVDAVTRSSEVGLLCGSTYPETATNVFSTSDPDFTGPLPTGAVLQTVALSSLMGNYNMYQNVIPVRWQTTDTEIMRLLASSTGTQSSGITDPAATESHTPSGLSPGAIAGIVIGSLGGIALILVGCVLMWIRRRKARDGSHGEAGLVHARSEEWVKPELDGRDAYAELEEPCKVTELSANQKHQAWEMASDSVAAELE